jgi:hypothetical protein
MDFINNLPIQQIHVLTVFVTLAIVVMADIHGLLWILGKRQTLPRKRMGFFHRGAWAGVLVIILTGILMFVNESAELLSLPAFQLKMFFVLCLFVNAFFIGKHLMIATVSTICWIGAFVTAQML